MDISQMTEEEQFQAAMALSLLDTGPAVPAAARAPGTTAAAPTTAPAATAAQAARPHPEAPGRGQTRAFPAKDGQDVLSPPQGSSAKKTKLEADQAGTHVQLTPAEVAELLRLIFGESPDPPDVERWFNVGFQFSAVAGTQWGLWQKQGGPCGIFAPVQAFIVKHLLFSSDAAEGSAESAAAQRQERPLSFVAGEDEDARASVLAYALASILFQATPLSSYVVCQVSPQGEEGASGVSSDAEGVSTAVALATAGAGTVAVTGRRVSRAADLQQLLEEGIHGWLSGPYGVLSFVCSVLLSRTLTTVIEDMDVDGNPLIGRFGHCSQELVNLMLIGEATSNVFDGTRWLGDDPSSGLLLKGVDGDRIGVPLVGFLSELEPMRLVSVGTLYKHPEYPVWVLGSPNHYTLLFSTRRSDSQLSPEAQLEQKAKKVFAENAFDEGGLAMSSNLRKMLEALGVAPASMAKAQSDLVREDVILWEDFRSWVAKHFGFDGKASKEASPGRVRLFLYDGQDPPGPNVRAITLELCDIDPSLAGGSEGDAFAATLHTRWPNAIIDVQAVAGAGSQGS